MGAGIGPFSKSGLDEALGLAVGSGSVGPGADVLEAELLAGVAEGVGFVARAVVGEDAADADAKAWSNFLGSDTGAKLRHIRWNRVYESQQRAICDRKDPAYSAGMAFGILAMTSEEDQLLQISLPDNANLENTRGTSDFRSVNR